MGLLLQILTLDQDTAAQAIADTVDQAKVAMGSSFTPESLADYLVNSFALLGIIIALLILWKLVVKSKEHQEQMEQLSAIAENQVSMTNILAQQLEGLTKQIQDFDDHAKTLSNTLKAYEDTLNRQQHLSEQLNALSKNFAKGRNNERLVPHFIIDNKEQYISEKMFTLALRNIAGEAQNILLDTTLTDMNINVVFHEYSRNVQRGGKVSLDVMVSSTNPDPAYEPDFQFKIMFKDIEGHLFGQSIVGTAGKVDISEPYLL